MKKIAPYFCGLLKKPELTRIRFKLGFRDFYRLNIMEKYGFERKSCQIRADEENIVSPLSFKSIPRPPIIRLDDNNNSSLGSEDPQSPRGEAITR